MSKPLRLVAKYADATNIPMGFDDEGVVTAAHKLAVLKEHCAREGRPYDAIEKTVLATLRLTREAQSKGVWVTAGQALTTLSKFRDAGVDQMIFNMPNVERPETLELAAEEIVRRAGVL